MRQKKKMRILAATLPAVMCLIAVLYLLPIVGVSYGSAAPTETSAHVDTPSGNVGGETSEPGGISSTTDDSFAGLLLPAEMPLDFSIRFEMWFDESRKNILDTRQGYIQKDLVSDGIAQVSFTIDPALLKEIYDKARLTDVAAITREMTSAVLSTDDLLVCISPLTCYRIVLTAGGKTYTIVGDATAYHYAEKQADAMHFRVFTEYITDILRQTEEYRSLPAQKGAYS